MRQQNKKRIEKLLLTVIMTILISVQVFAAVDVISPDNVHINSVNVTFDYYVDMDPAAQECTLIVDSSPIVTDANITNSAPNGFIIANMPVGNHSWKVSCTDLTVVEESSETTLLIDVENPSISLLEPEDHAEIIGDVDFKFTATDNEAEFMQCNLSIDDAEVVTDITAQDNVQITETVEGLSPGDYEWYISCKDSAGNLEISVERDLTIEGEAEYSISLDKTEYNLGETATLTIDAPDGTNLTLDVCPDGEGFVECFAALTFEDESYPLIQVLPYTNQSGDFIIDAFFAYEEDRQVRRLTYEVLSTMVATISGDTNLVLDEETLLTGDAQGGIGSIAYEWTIHNGSKYYTKSIFVVYNDAGTFEETLKVTDEAENEATKTITVTIIQTYPTTVKVLDANTREALKGVAVQIGSKEAVTNNQGQVIIDAKEGNNDVFAYTGGYALYEGEVTISSETTFEILLSKQEGDELSVELMGPSPNSYIESGTVELAFRALGATEADCKLLYKEEGNAYSEISSISVKNSGDHSFELEVEEGSASWKIECSQKGKTVSSAPRTFNIGEEPEEEPVVSAGDLNQDSMTSELNRILTSYSGFDVKERELAQKLGLFDSLKKTIKVIKRSERDIHDLRFRTSIDEKEKERLRKEMIESTLEEYNSVITDIEISDSKTFVKYYEKEEIEDAVRLFAESEELHQDMELLVNAVNSMQGEIVISTKAYEVLLTRLDGTQESMTAVIKDVKYEDTPAGAYIIEYIPKEIVSSAEDLKIIGEHEILEDDPLISFPLREEIIYQIPKNVPLEDLQQVVSLLISDSLQGDLSEITGTVTLGIPKISLGDKNFLIIIVILLTGLYSINSMNILTKTKWFFNSKNTEKEIHYMRVLINDALDNLEVENYDKASLIYREIKLTYDTVSPQVRILLHEEIMELVNKLDIFYSRDLSKRIEEALSRNNLKLAKEHYKNLQNTYKKLDEEYKKEIYSTIMKIAQRLQK